MAQQFSVLERIGWTDQQNIHLGSFIMSFAGTFLFPGHGKY